MSPTSFIAAAVATLTIACISSALAQEDDLIRGVVKPIDQAVLAADLVAKVQVMPFRDGDRFNQGDVLIGFDCSRYKAEQAAAWSAHRAYKKTWQTNKELLSYNAIGSNEVELSQAEMSRAASQAQVIQVRMEQCEIKAPFSGRVVETFINRHEMPAANQELIRIINDSELELDLIVPSRWLVWLRDGSPFAFRVDETGQTYQAKVKRIGASVDAVSQTIKITGTFEQRPERVLPGMSGSARFDIPRS